MHFWTNIQLFKEVLHEIVLNIRLYMKWYNECKIFYFLFLWQVKKHVV